MLPILAITLVELLNKFIAGSAAWLPERPVASDRIYALRSPFIFLMNLVSISHPAIDPL